MDLRDRAVALYGRFSAGTRDRLQAEIERRGGEISRDLTRLTSLLVVGALATPLIGSGSLLKRIRTARERGIEVLGERAFEARFGRNDPHPSATFPLATAMAQTGLTREDVEVLAAFDLVTVDGEACGFGDVRIFRTAADLIGDRTWAETVRVLQKARDLAPEGRHKIVLTPQGEPALEWTDGLSTLDGQGYLPLDEVNASVEELFEAAELAEARSDLTEAARLFDLCARADRSDPVAVYNYANIFLEQGKHDQAILAYRRALARNARFIEARYNLAKALEAAGKLAEASAELVKVLAEDPEHSDAIFNLAQLRMKNDELGAAISLYRRFLEMDPPEPWASTARRAIHYCSVKLTA